MSVFVCFVAALYGQTTIDARTQTRNGAHAPTHRDGGNDEIASATPAANAIPKADSGGRLSSGWLPDLSGLYQRTLGFTPLSRSSNLSDLTDPPAARTSLGLGAAALKGALGTGSGLMSGSGSFGTGAIPVTDSSGTLMDSGCSVSNAVLTCGSGAASRLGVRKGAAPADTLLNGVAHDAVFFLDVDGDWKMRRLDGSLVTISGASTITSFTNAQHGHTSAAGGGQLDEGAFRFTDVTTGNATSATHGLLPKLPNNGSLCFRGDGSFGACASPGGTSGQIQTNAGGAFGGLSTTGNGTLVVTSPAAPADGCAQYAGGNLGSTGAPCGSGSGSTAVSAGTIASALYCVDTSQVANSVTCAPATAFPGSYGAGQTLFVKVAAANSGPVTINVAGLGQRGVSRPGGVALSAGDLQGGGVYAMTYDGTAFIVAPAGAASSGGPLQVCAATTGSSSAGSCSTSPTFTPVPGSAVVFQADVANSGPFTLNVNSSGDKPVVRNGNAPLSAGDILASPFQALLIYDGSAWEMQGQPGNAGPAGSGPAAGSNISVAGSVVSFDPLDSSALVEWDDFLSSSSSAGQIGKLGWTANSIGASGCASALPAASVGGHPFLYTMTTSASGTGLGCAFNLNNSASPSNYPFGARRNWSMKWIVKLPTAANVSYKIGYAASSSITTNPPAAGFWLKYNTGDSDTTLEWEVFNSSASVGTADTGIAINTSAFYEPIIYSTAPGTIRAYLKASYVVSGATWSGGTATLTIGANHHLQVGDVVTVGGLNPVGYDCTGCTITAVAATTISYAVASSPGSYSSGGAVLSPPTPEVTACASGCTINGTVSVSGMTPVVQAVTLTSGAAAATVDWFGIQIKGVAR